MRPDNPPQIRTEKTPLLKFLSGEYDTVLFNNLDVVYPLTKNGLHFTVPVLVSPFNQALGITDHFLRISALALTAVTTARDPNIDPLWVYAKLQTSYPYQIPGLEGIKLKNENPPHIHIHQTIDHYFDQRQITIGTKNKVEGAKADVS